MIYGETLASLNPFISRETVQITQEIEANPELIVCFDLFDQRIRRDWLESDN